jgi:WD40 repeat protein
MSVTEAHPSPEQLAAFTLGTLGDDAHAPIEAHVATCVFCQERAAVAPADALTELLRAAHRRTGRQDDTATDAAQAQTPTPLSAVAQTGSPESAVAPPAPGPWEGSDVPDLVPPELARHERYRVVRLLGAGGMGAVYEAEHRAMQRIVALKVINRATTSRPGAAERFRREVRAAARLSHPNVVCTYDAEDAGNTLFLVMEHVDGVTLGRLVQERGPLPVAEACGYVRQAALGLQHAHERGMVHRDVKPDNLILTVGPGASGPGSIKVLDFGLAALLAERGDEPTETNLVMGTPDYMAPEQAEDPRSADIRADVYSLGCTLYYLLTGRVPYPGATSLRTILAHREQPVPSVRHTCPDVPAELARVLGRLLAKKPGDRYQTPAEVAAALEPFTPVAARPPRNGRPLLAAVAAAALFAGTVLAGAVAYRIQTDKGELVITSESNDIDVLIKEGGRVVRVIDVTTDKQVALTLRSGVYELELKGVPEGLKLSIDKATLTRGQTVLAKIERVPAHPSPVTITPLHSIRWAEGNRFSSTDITPDGRYFLASRDFGAGNVSRTRVWDTRTGALVRELPRYIGRLAPDGTHVITNGGWDGDFQVNDLATGKEIRRFETHVHHWNFALSSTGTRLLYVTPLGGQVWDWSVGKKLCDFPWTLSDATALTPDGRYLLQQRGGKPSLRVLDAETGKPVEDVYPQLREVSRLRGISADGKLLLSTDGRTPIQVIDMATGKALAPLEGEPTDGLIASDGRVVLAPSKERTAFGLWAVAGGRRLATLRFPLNAEGEMECRLAHGGSHAVFTGPGDSVYLFRLPELPAAKDSP